MQNIHPLLRVFPAIVVLLIFFVVGTVPAWAEQKNRPGGVSQEAFYKETNPATRRVNNRGQYVGKNQQEHWVTVPPINICRPTTTYSAWRTDRCACTKTRTRTVSCGGGSSTETVALSADQCDQDPPTLSTSSPVLTATHQYQSDIVFADECAIRTIELRIPDANGVDRTYTSTNQKKASINNHDFSQAGFNNLTWTACDQRNNCTTNQTVSDFFRVVAGAPDFAGGRATLALSGGDAVADGSTTHQITATLRDRYNNPVIPVAGIKNVDVRFAFQNTLPLDQIAGTGDAAVLRADEFGWASNANATRTPRTQSSGWLAETTAAADGIYQLTLGAYAPTSAGFAEINDAGFDLAFTRMDYRVRALGGHGDVGAVESSRSRAQLNAEQQERAFFAFSPTLVSVPDILNFDTETQSYRSATPEERTVSVNNAKRILIALQNASNTKATSSNEIGLLMEADDPEITWRHAVIERNHGSDDSQPLTLDTASPFAAVWNALSGTVAETQAGETRFFRYRSTPELNAGAQAAGNTPTNIFRTFVGYLVDGLRVRHVGYGIDTPSGAADIQNSNIQIIGAAYASGDIFSRLASSPLNTSIGDTVKTEAKEQIEKNIAPFVSANTSHRPCTQTVVLDGQNWHDYPGCTFGQGSILFVQNADVIFESPTGTVAAPPRAMTILVHGGNIHLRSNIARGEHQLGIIAKKNDNHDNNPFNDGATIYLRPAVSHLALALYTEGSIIALASDDSLNFRDRSHELRQQLYIRGSIISHNSIGGADMSPVRCPEGISCNAVAALLHYTDNPTREAARLFDLSYLRMFSPNGGLRATNPPPPGGTANNHSMIVEYDSRIKQNPPPLFSETSSASSQEGGY